MNCTAALSAFDDSKESRKLIITMFYCYCNTKVWSAELEIGLLLKL